MLKHISLFFNRRRRPSILKSLIMHLLYYTKTHLLQVFGLLWFSAVSITLLLSLFDILQQVSDAPERQCSWWREWYRYENDTDTIINLSSDIGMWSQLACINAVLFKAPSIFEPALSLGHTAHDNDTITTPKKSFA